ncbi:MAG: hypothetical protein ABI150_14300 [Nitrobacter sp.]
MLFGLACQVGIAANDRCAMIHFWIAAAGAERNRSYRGPEPRGLVYLGALQEENLSIGADFEIAKGERVQFVLTYGPSHRGPPAAIDANIALDETLACWGTWSARCNYKGHRREAVIRSSLMLKALTFAETGVTVPA